MGDLLGSPRVAPLLPFLRFIFFPRFRFPLFLYSLLHESSFRAISSSKMHCCIAEKRQMLFFVAGFNAFYQLLRLNMSSPIIPALTHRIPSELRSQACLGESRTRMGDLLEVLVLHPFFLFTVLSSFLVFDFPCFYTLFCTSLLSVQFLLAKCTAASPKNAKRSFLWLDSMPYINSCA